MGSLTPLLPLLLLLLLAPFTPGTQGQGDPCTALSRKLKIVDGRSAFARPSEVIPCTQSVAFKRGRDLGTLESVKQSIRHFYALYKIGSRSPEPRLPSTHDPVAELDKITKFTWKTAEGFYDAVRRAIQLINDGHTNIRFGCPPFRHSLALPLVQTIGDKGQQEIRVAPASMFSGTYTKALRQAPYNFDPVQYAGSLVTQIDGKPAWQYLRDWVSRNPTFYHDPSQQVNAALASIQWTNGSEFVSYGAFGDRVENPKTDFLRMTISRKNGPSVVSVPWLSYIRASQLFGFANTQTYYGAFCAPQFMSTSRVARADRLNKNSAKFQQNRSTNAAKGWLEKSSGGGFTVNIGVVSGPSGKGGGRLPPPLNMVDPVTADEKTVFQSRGVVALAPPAQGNRLSKAGDYFPVYLLKDGKTAVVQLHTFYPDLPLDTDQDFYVYVNFWLGELDKSLRLANRNARQVIIDMSGNRGGLVLFVDWAVELLVGTQRFKAKRKVGLTPINYRADTELLRQMQRQNLGNLNFSQWSDLNGQPFKSKEQFFLPLRDMTFGSNGRVGTYSAWSTFGPYYLSDATESFYRPAFGTKPVVIFSNGLCYSACTFFTTLMRVEHGFKLATVGGIKGSRMNFGGGGGGYVSHVEEAYISSFSNSVRAMADAPKRFGIRTEMFVTACNSFQLGSPGVPRAARTDSPLEFNFLGEDFRVNYDIRNVEDKSLVYQKVASLAFPK